MNNPFQKQVQRKIGGQYVAFSLGETQFGVPILQTLRIERLTPITRVPRAPSFLKGIINLHGQAVPIIDLCERLAFPSTTPKHATRILFVELEDQVVGMLVDSVNGILRLAVDAIQPPTEMVGAFNGAYLIGMAHFDGQLMLILNLHKVLTVEDVIEMNAWQTSNSE